MRPFQITLFAVFGVLAIASVIILTTFQSKKAAQEKVYGESVIMWGTLSQDAFTPLLQDIVRTDKAFSVVEYRQFDTDTFDFELVNAIAEGRSPDLVVLSSHALTTHRSKLVPISYDNLPLRTFKDTFIDGAQIFALTEGIYGIPFAVDPLVLYWNTALLSTQGFAKAPAYWEDFAGEPNIVSALTTHDPTGRNVIQSGLAFGGFSNVVHAKQTLLMFALQLGSKMTVAEADRYVVALDESQVASASSPLQKVIAFYTQFSDPRYIPTYSWNGAKKLDVDEFLSGTLSLYFGLGSEYVQLQEKNPNLSFDIAHVPHGKNATVYPTYGDFYAFAIPRATKNIAGAYAVANVLASKDNMKRLSQSLHMAPARRDVIAEGDTNPYRSVILKSALLAQGWLDPGDKKSDEIFKRLVENVVSGGSLRIADAVNDAIDSLTLAY